ncbi:MAG: SDR family NAD(P)-dependent oxidoreductase, partial [Chloroflexi bacterium]|nr:SDR family NAD(P)-dependent oxidoreductase [Chloroflexota bacterium]
MLFDLTGRVAVVTGGSQGIGRGIALTLAEHGADVAIVARAPEAVAGGTERIHRPVDPVVQEIEAMGRRSLGVLADVRDSEQVQGMAAQVTGAFGRVDILVNNAGITVRKEPEALAANEWDRVLDVTLRAAFLASGAVYPPMKAQGGGKLIHI